MAIIYVFVSPEMQAYYLRVRTMTRCSLRQACELSVLRCKDSESRRETEIEREESE